MCTKRYYGIISICDVVIFGYIGKCSHFLKKQSELEKIK